MKAFTVLSLLFFSVITMNGKSSLAAGTLLHCGNSDGTSNAYFDLTTQQISLNRDSDDLSTAIPMSMIRFTQTASPFSIEADATHPLIGPSANFHFKVSPDSTLVITLSASDGSSNASAPLQCQRR